MPADVPTAAELDAVSLNNPGLQSGAPQKADAVVGSGAADVAGEAGPGNLETEPAGGITEAEPAGNAPGTPAPAPEVEDEPRPAWPVAGRRGPDADNGLRAGLISGSVRPDAVGGGVGGPDPAAAAGLGPASLSAVGPASPAGLSPAGLGGVGPASYVGLGSASLAGLGPGRARRPDAAGDAVADAAVVPPVFLLDASQAVLSWARRRYIGLSSATGISIALAVCAAAWFSAGTSADTVRGVTALWCSYLILVAGRLVTGRADAAEADRRVAGPVRWLGAIGGSIAEVAVYAGLTIGAAVDRYPGVWATGLGVVGLTAVRNLMTASSTPYGLRQPPETLFGRICTAAVTMAPGGRILLIGIVAPVLGARMALLALLAWGISTVGYGLAGRAAPDVEAEFSDADGAATASAKLLRLRDDGMLARYLGALVRGSLLPLPPAILGLAAVTALAVLGLHGLPGLLLMAPAFVILLAAPGSANAHLGRLDWLVPVLLLSSQILYFGAVGSGGRVPGPVVFALAAALLVRYTDLACAQRPVLLIKSRRHDSVPREYGTALGWEGRVLFIGVAAALGIATAGYLALTAYLVLLIGAKAVRSCIMSPDDADRGQR